MTKKDKVNVGILGASGYIGAELMRYLSVHPRVELVWKSAHSQEGREIAEVFPNLRGAVEGRFASAAEAEERLGDVECVFVALPHNESQEVIPRLVAARPDMVVIDMGGDFRANDAALYARYYGKEHVAKELLSRFVYGLTELNREALRGARLIANPGCFATGLILALAPLARAGVLPSEVPAVGITGSSGSGNRPSGTTHHPERATNIRAYKPLTHQHLLEVEHFLSRLGEPVSLRFVPQSGPFVRGIFITAFLPDSEPAAVRRIFDDAYGAEPLIGVVDGSPELRWVQGTPRAFIGVAGESGRGSVVFSVTDNLGKGAAGQAVQNLNLAFGFDETEGLLWPGGYV
ncbi:MAG TPA: N-acetyl-gamma-glutamyl-phosphate reductase [Planctomycetota bacterium]|nr:N-acetyl-gamma-glutamyl-phosphate reductase [Planctomycetota bacterium]